MRQAPVRNESLHSKPTNNASDGRTYTGPYGSSIGFRPLLRSLKGYAFALGGVAVATGITWSVLHSGARELRPIVFFAYLLAIMASAWWGGYGAGLLAVAL